MIKFKRPFLLSALCSLTILWTMPIIIAQAIYLFYLGRCFFDESSVFFTTHLSVVGAVLSFLRLFFYMTIFMSAVAMLKQRNWGRVLILVAIPLYLIYLALGWHAFYPSLSLRCFLVWRSVFVVYAVFVIVLLNSTVTQYLKIKGNNEEQLEYREPRQRERILMSVSVVALLTAIIWLVFSWVPMTPVGAFVNGITGAGHKGAGVRVPALVNPDF